MVEQGLERVYVRVNNRDGARAAIDVDLLGTLGGNEGLCGVSCHHRASAGLQSTCLNSVFAFSIRSKPNATRQRGAGVKPFL